MQNTNKPREIVTIHSFRTKLNELGCSAKIEEIYHCPVIHVAIRAPSPEAFKALIEWVTKRQSFRVTEPSIYFDRWLSPWECRFNKIQYKMRKP